MHHEDADTTRCVLRGNIQVCFFNLRDIGILRLLLLLFSMCNEQFLYLTVSSTAGGSDFQETKKFNMIWRGASLCCTSSSTEIEHNLYRLSFAFRVPSTQNHFKYIIFDFF